MATEGLDNSSSSSTTTTTNQYPLALLVNVEIQEDRIEEFLSIMNQDALDSRTKEVKNLIIVTYSIIKASLISMKNIYASSSS